MIWLSKTRIQNGRQCHKRLWLEVHNRQLAQWTPSSQARLDEGTAFGELARELLGAGTLIEANHMEPDLALEQTAAALARPRLEAALVYEPAFAFDGVRVRVDAIERGIHSDTLIEVKSTTGVKPEHVWDCAIQTWVARNVGRNVRHVHLAHLNKEFVYRKPGYYDGLLTRTDITDEVERVLPEVPGIVSQLKRVVNGSLPQITSGTHCTTPYACPFMEYCKANEPPAPEYPVDLLPRGAKVANDLVKLGYTDLARVPIELLTHPVHRMVAEVTQSGRTRNAPELNQALKAIVYPRYYLDFECISFVVPRWVGTRPFEQVPFQFSCHIETEEHGAPHHEGYLDLEDSLPTQRLAKRLVEVLGDRGPILVWNASFEKAVIARLASAHRSLRRQLLALNDRIVDLLPLYREHYYHRKQRGSWSIKAVLPTVAPHLRYDELAVGDGMAAQETYRVALTAARDAAALAKCRESLERYCAMDTAAMVALTAITRADSCG